MSKVLFQGVIVPIITPFRENETVDEEGFCANIEFLINDGVHGIVVGGSSGEFYILNLQERMLLLELALKQASGRIPIYAATGADSTLESIKLTEHAKKMGAAGSLVLPPAFIPPSGQEIVQHYRDICSATDLPICLYNLPARTQVNLVPVIEQLATLPNVVAIKESTSDLLQMGEIIRRTNGALKVLMGHDLLILPAISMGASGTISPSPNVFGRLTVELYNLATQNRVEAARKLQYILFEFRSTYGMGTFPLVIKEAMNIIGRYGGFPRRPTRPLSDASKKQLRDAMENLKVFPNLT